MEKLKHKLHIFAFINFIKIYVGYGEILNSQWNYNLNDKLSIAMPTWEIIKYGFKE